MVDCRSQTELIETCGRHNLEPGKLESEMLNEVLAEGEKVLVGLSGHENYSMSNSKLQELQNADHDDVDGQKYGSEDAEACDLEKGFVGSPVRFDSYSKEILDHSEPLEETVALPPKAGPRLYRVVRWVWLPTYQRLFCLILLINLGILVSLLLVPKTFTYTNASDAVAANILLCVAMRQEHVLNALFFCFGSLSHKVPLRVRRWSAKIYTFGGIHSACGVSATIWYLALAGIVTKHLYVEPYVEPSIATLTYTILLLFLVITSFAHPSIRRKLHNSFEAAHRFGGWIVTVLFWIQTCLITISDESRAQQSFSEMLLTSLPFWTVTIITLCLIYPWLHLRRCQVRPEPLSSHAVRLHFAKGYPKPCQSLRISDNPLRETHAFVMLPSENGAQGFSMVVSAAGDWTKRIIRNPPSKIWIKGTPFYGVMHLARLFKSVVLVATGSGIAPCLSLLCHRPRINCRILWSTPSPVDTYGEPILDAVLENDADAMIVDTRKSGRPDLTALAWKLYSESRAEAVFVVSNAKVTKKVVYGLETRGVPAFAPIFDS